MPSPMPPLGNLDSGFNLRAIVGDADIADAMSAFSRMRFQHQRLLDTLGERLGITSSDIRALFFFTANEGATPKDAAEFLGVTTGAMTSLIDRNERAGLVHRAPHPHDRRSVLLELTPAGRDAVGLWASQYREAFEEAIPHAMVADTASLFRNLAHSLGERADELRTTED